MTKFSLPLLARLRHRLIMSRWQRWWFPLLCSLPYILALFWLLLLGLHWIVWILIAPLFMACVIAVFTWLLARQEFR